MMIRKMIALLLLVTTMLAAPVLFMNGASAYDPVGVVCSKNPKASVCTDNKAGEDSTNPIFGKSGVLTVVIRILSIAVGIIATLIIIVSGLRMTLTNGDSNSVSTARKGIIFALVALVVAIIAQVLVVLVLSKIKV